MDRKNKPAEFEFDDILIEDLDDILAEPPKSEENKTGAAVLAVSQEAETAAEAAAAEKPDGTAGTETEPAAETVAEKEPAEETAAEKASAGETAEAGAAGEAAEQPAEQKETDAAEQKEKTSKDKKQPKKKKKGLIALIIVLSVLVAAAIGAYGYGVYYYTGHFLPWTEAEGVRLDNLTLEQAQQKLTDSKIEEDSILTLHTLEGETVPMSTAAMGIRRNYLGLPEILETQEKWIFPVSKDKEKVFHLNYEVVCDPAEASTELEKLEICDPEKTVAPVDSYVEKDKRGVWKVVPPVDGNTIDREALAGVIGRAVMNKETDVDLAAEKVYLTAQIREDDPQLNRRAKLENMIDAIDLQVDLGADTVVKITPEEFRGLLTAEAWNTEPADADAEKKEAEAGKKEDEEPQLIDGEKFDDYVFRLAVRYDTKAASGWRTFRSLSGDAIVLKSDYGWEMDREATGSLLKILLQDAAYRIFKDEKAEQTFKDGSIEAVWKQTALSHGERDTGDSWVEVDITTQKMYCVMKGETVLESNVVTGMEMNKGRRTPEGIFAVRFKQCDRDLVGFNADGTEAYRSHVSYWMPVYNNIGLHDASWRGSFGGNTYIWSGSHGCVNLPVKTAGKLYDIVEKGTPVIIYRESEKKEEEKKEG